MALSHNPYKNYRNPSHDHAHDIDSTGKVQEKVVVPVTVLSPEQFKRLKQLLPRSIPREGSTPQEVGFLLGIQHALNVLQEGFTQS